MNETKKCYWCGGDLLAVCDCYNRDNPDSMNAWAHEVLYGEDEREIERTKQQEYEDNLLYGEDEDYS